MSPARLDRELARRGWNASDLAKASGIGVATISAARRGRPVSNATLWKIADALLKTPVVPGIDDLLEPDAEASFDSAGLGSVPVQIYPLKGEGTPGGR